MKERELVDSIREEYSGLRDAPRKSLANSVKALAEDLYAKDTHFIFELIQNAEDNEYSSLVSPRLRFSIGKCDIDGIAELALILHNNENGFGDEHVRAICQVGESTKKKVQGYIGEKGIGFKSVFRITKCPYIFSNQFQFCLPDHDEETGLRYIVPRWVPDQPSGIIANDETIIVLPINKDDKSLATVIRALRDIAPETLLFLKKLHAIDISVQLPNDQYEILVEKSIQADSESSYIVDLTYLKRSKGVEDTIRTSRYWVTEIEYAKPDHVNHEKRVDILSRPVSIAIPLTSDVSADESQGKLFAYLPVRDGTGLPFIINADFLLASSREEVKVDEEWNQWLRDCVAETYTTAFLRILSSSNLSFAEKVMAYGSIPLESHYPFLKSIVPEIQQTLSEHESALVLPDRSMATPHQARRCTPEYRALFTSSNSLPTPLLDRSRLVCPELEQFSLQLQAIKVALIRRSECIASLRDTVWVHNQQLTWYVNLFRYLQSQKFESITLRQLLIVPVDRLEQGKPRFSCDEAQPIYFSLSKEDEDALASVPDWLSVLVPIDFLDSEFLEILDVQKDKESLMDWLTNTLNVYDFSIGNYCVDILSKLEQSHLELKDDRLIQATEFLIRHASSEFDWERIPVILSDDRRMPLHEVKDLTDKQAVVVPENYNLQSGWQHIWISQAEQQHFAALHSKYPDSVIREFVRKKVIQVYPPPINFNPRSYVQFSPYEQECVGEISQTSIYKVSNYRPPSCLLSDSPVKIETSNAILGWIESIGIEGYQDCEIDYFYYTRKQQSFLSEFLVCLKKACWLPSTRGLVRPCDAFLAKPHIVEVFGDTIPYFKGTLPDSVIGLLDIRTEVKNEDLISLLEENSGKTDVNSDLVSRIYTQLNARTLSVDSTLRFDTAPIIYIKDKQGTTRWCKKAECVWEDASLVLGDSFVYLSNHYPKLQTFFIDRLGVKRSVDTESYSQRWIQFQEEPIGDIDERRKVVERLYREIRSLALAVILEKSSPRPIWWRNFFIRMKVYTQSDKFVQPINAVLPDDGELRDIFRDSDVEYAWRPDKDAFSEWGPFYRAFSTPFLSESAEQQLDGDVSYRICSLNHFVTEAAIKMIASWLREKRKEEYQSLLEGNVFQQLAATREAVTSSEIQVKFRLKAGGVERVKSVTYPVFWDRSHNVLIYGPNPELSKVAKILSKGLMTGQTDKDLAHWIELVLGASDTSRLKGETWSVPQPVLDLFGQDRQTTIVSTSPILTESVATPSLPDAPAPVLEHSALPVDSKLDIVIQDDNLRLNHQHDDSQKDTTRQTSRTNAQDNKEGKPALPTPVAQPQVNDLGSSGTEVTNSRDSYFTTYGQNGATDRINYPEELERAFYRKGLTQFADTEDVLMHQIGHATVRNPQRRTQKLTEDVRDNIDQEPLPEERRNVTERSLLESPNEQVRTALFDWYRGKCQICDDTWPKQDGEPYFTAAYLVERHNARWVDDPGNAICLCAKHFAQWRHAAREAPLDIVAQVRSMRLRIDGGNGNLSIEFTMLGEDVGIRYDESHLLALQAILDA